MYSDKCIDVDNTFESLYHDMFDIPATLVVGLRVRLMPNHSIQSSPPTLRFLHTCLVVFVSGIPRFSLSLLPSTVPPPNDGLRQQCPLFASVL